MSETAGETATVVKLIRVTMLAPVILIFGLCLAGFGVERQTGERPPSCRDSSCCFFALAAVNSFELIPAGVRDLLADISRWALLTAIAAVGMKRRCARSPKSGTAAIVLICAETLFLAAFICIGVRGADVTSGARRFRLPAAHRKRLFVPRSAVANENVCKHVFIL